MATPGTKVWLEPNDDPKKKLKFGWRLIEQNDGHFVGVDTSVPNRALKHALIHHKVSGLPPYDAVRTEVPYGTSSRVDFVLDSGLGEIYVEVKSVTLSRQAGIAEFPDSVTARGAKHMETLAQMVELGHRAIVLFLVQRTDCTAMSIARDIDPAYARAFDMARDAGVTPMAIGTEISPYAIDVAGPIRFLG